MHASPSPLIARPLQPTRRQLALSLLALPLVGCGGGGGGGAAPGEPNQGPAGTRESGSIQSRITNTTYPLSFYLPPASAGPRSSLPVLYVLDGESWTEVMAGIVDAARTRVIIVGIHGAGMRSRDFVPANSCTSSGGGQALYFDFLRNELMPQVESTVGGDPRQRLLFGHSHGGSFVLYAMFAQSPGAHAFRSYLAVDASLGCMPNEAQGWDQNYARNHTELPVRLHLSCASGGNYAANVAYGQTIEQRRYARLALVSTSYSGTHNGIVPQAFTEGLAFALAATAG